MEQSQDYEIFSDSPAEDHHTRLLVEVGGVKGLDSTPVLGHQETMCLLVRIVWKISYAWTPQEYKKELPRTYQQMKQIRLLAEQLPGVRSKFQILQGFGVLRRVFSKFRVL